MNCKSSVEEVSRKGAKRRFHEISQAFGCSKMSIQCKLESLYKADRPYIQPSQGCNSRGWQ